MAIAANQAGITAVASPSASLNPHSYIDWPAILAGAVLACAISFVLLTFGSAIGLSLTSPFTDRGASIGLLAVATGLWVVWVEVSSFMAGAYLTGRMRRRVNDATEHEVDVRDAAHGLLVWAVGALLGALIAVSSVAGAVRTATEVASDATAVTLDQAQAGNPDRAFSLLVDSLFRSDTPGDAVSPERRGEVARILASSAVKGTLSDSDRMYVGRIIAAESNLSQAEAEARVTEMFTEAKATADQAKAAAEKARKIGILVAFITAASLLVSAAAAVFAAGRGGRHRDKELVLPALAGWK